MEGFWRSHQVPLAGMHDNPAHLKQLEKWLRSYKPEELFDESGRLIPELQELAPKGQPSHERQPARQRRPAAQITSYAGFPHLRHRSGKARPTLAENTRPLGKFLRDVMRQNMTNFRVFGPDENTSNKLDDIYEVSKKLWLAGHAARGCRRRRTLDRRTSPGNAFRAYPGRMARRLSSDRPARILLHLRSLRSRHRFDVQSARQVAVRSVGIMPWRSPISSLNLLITSTVWRQDHNGFTHQDPGFLDVVVNKSPDVCRIYLPPDVNTLLCVAEPLPQEHQLHQRHRLRQAEASSIHDDGRSDRPLHQGHQHLAKGEQ